MRILSLSEFIPEQICDIIRFTQYHGDRNINHYCGYVSDFISQVRYDDSIDGCVFPRSCDSTRIMNRYLSGVDKFVYQILVPARQDNLAINFFAKGIADYQKAIEKADEKSKELYEESGKEIEEIRRQIWSLSQKEEPYDVFICYKETDKEGKRTRDSVLANELYHELKEEGYKVFFSRITLENKLGENYESCIFSALHTSKVMVVIGTKAEYLNSVWVKNEWSRYLELIKQGEKKILIPAYSEMDPYDLPEEFSHLQAQDMSKLGFMQDLVRGIKKIASEEKEEGKEVKVVQSTTVVEDSNISVEALMKRIEIFLEYEEWIEANEYCEKVLDRDPENAQAYLYKIMANVKVKKKEDLVKSTIIFDDKTSYKKLMQFADSDLAEEIKDYAISARERICSEKYDTAFKILNKESPVAITASSIENALEILEDIKGYKDVDELIEKWEVELARKKEEENKIGPGGFFIILFFIILISSCSVLLN